MVTISKFDKVDFMEAVDFWEKEGSKNIDENMRVSFDLFRISMKNIFLSSSWYEDKDGQLSVLSPEQIQQVLEGQHMLKDNLLLRKPKALKMLLEKKESLQQEAKSLQAQLNSFPLPQQEIITSLAHNVLLSIVNQVVTPTEDEYLFVRKLPIRRRG